MKSPDDWYDSQSSDFWKGVIFSKKAYKHFKNISEVDGVVETFHEAVKVWNIYKNYQSKPIWQFLKMSYKNQNQEYKQLYQVVKHPIETKNAYFSAKKAVESYGKLDTYAIMTFQDVYHIGDSFT